MSEENVVAVVLEVRMRGSENATKREFESPGRVPSA